MNVPSILMAVPTFVTVPLDLIYVAVGLDMVWPLTDTHVKV